ncbi:NAD(P)-binding protein [Aspergillus fijiensis CBS 313.89]|uniref:NAD(P)-binding protein n=1 Tax=Aspergillus fijiensis CBS 313.89 TaxID=1448319 RepID=A0A8G1VX61_9EURO|nr:NAD(P)-binding protein [Aspergillus fijiensis CBS 313.89]RAK72679.1 NAD(P)-binding protein [Aspergillus fijiensis CBS 313.89]
MILGVGRAIVEELGAQGKHEVILWSRRDPSELKIPGVNTLQVTDYSHENLVNLLKGTHTVLAFFNPMSDPGSQNQIALIDAAVAANVTRFAPSEWAGKVRSGIKMYDMKLPVLDHLENLNKDKTVIEWGLFQPGLLMDYLAHPCPPSKHFDTFPLLFDLENARACLVEDGSAPLVFTSSADVAKVVARAIDYPGTWTVDGGIVGQRTSYKEVVQTAEKITGQKFTIYTLRPEDLERGDFISPWVPAYAPNLSAETMRDVVVPFISGWALGIYRGVADVSPVWNERFPDLHYETVEEMLRGAWARFQAQKKAEH